MSNIDLSVTLTVFGVNGCEHKNCLVWNGVLFTLRFLKLGMTFELDTLSINLREHLRIFRACHRIEIALKSRKLIVDCGVRLTRDRVCT